MVFGTRLASGNNEGGFYIYFFFLPAQVLQEHDGTISIKELSDLTAIKTDDIISTLQFLNLIQYQKGQHVLLAAPKVIER